MTALLANEPVSARAALPGHRSKLATLDTIGTTDDLGCTRLAVRPTVGNSHADLSPGVVNLGCADREPHSLQDVTPATWPGLHG